MASLYSLSLTDMRRAVERGECTPQEIWTSCRQQIETHDAVVRAWQELTPTASGSDPVRGVLMGLPVGVKDTMDVLGLRAERGSPIWRGRSPQADAAGISLLKQHGARVMGKTVTTEFAYFTPGITVNPHRPTHTPGGSSSGSAAAVAAGMVPVALGSQTAASVIRPAAYCGVAGFVASVGELSLRGVMPLAHTLDAWGVLARDVADLQLMQSVMTSAPNPAPVMDSARTKPRAVLAIDGTAFGPVDEDMQAAFAQVLGDLAVQGVSVERDASDLLGPEGGLVWATRHRQLMAHEAAQTLAFEYFNDADGLSGSLRALIEEGWSVDAEAYEALKLDREVLRQRLRRVMGRYDAILAPAAPGAAPEGLAATGRPDQSRVWQFLGAPQVTLPAGWTDEGLPLGLQVVGGLRGDKRMLQIARWLQDELGWRGRLPSAFA